MLLTKQSFASLTLRLDFLVTSRWVLIFLALALLGRLTAFSIWPGWQAQPGYAADSDGADYHRIAQFLATTGRFAVTEAEETVTRPPAFPYWLAGLYRVFGIEATWAGFLGQHLFLTGIALCCWLVGKELFSPRVGGLALVLVSVDPVINYLGWTYLTELLHTFLLLVGLYVFYRGLRATTQTDWLGWVGAAGVVWALAVLTRPYFQLLILTLPLCALFWGKKAFQSALLVSAVVAVGLVPWLLRNHAVVGHWTPVTLNSGLALYGGTNSYAQGNWVLSSEHPDLYQDAPQKPEVERDAWFQTQAMTWIKAHPGRFVALMPLKLYRLFHFYNFTTRGAMQWAFALGGIFPYLVCLPFAFVAVWHRSGWSQLWPILAVSLPTILSALIFYGDVRMRVPIEPLIFILASSMIMRSIAPSVQALPYHQQ